MSFLFSSSGVLLLPFLLPWLLGFSSVLVLDLRERDALCNTDGCFVVYFARKTFLDSWRACKEQGGNLATIKRKEDANAIASLFSTVDLRHSQSKVQVWIGLQRQPRQCRTTGPLRGFSWTTGDQDTDYTKWQREDSPRMCLVPRCVVMGYSPYEQRDNFKWLDVSCSLPVDGYLCHYSYEGMCPAFWSMGAGNAVYTTPFNLVSTLLTHVPLGSVANIPCLTGTTEEQPPILCLLKENGSAGWSRDPPLCTDFSISHSLCDMNNGGCEHFCRTVGGLIFCECADGYQLGHDGRTCEVTDLCQGYPCEFNCLLFPDGYRCSCPDGYMLAPDKHSCLDVDECLHGPCEQLCKNVPGTFECQCWDGYHLNSEGECLDIDECTNNPCGHSCENTPGTYICHCHHGFSLDFEDPSQCQDVDECQITGICEQMCENYVGGFECHCQEGYELSDDYTCKKIREGDNRSTINPPFPRVTQQPGLVWDGTDYVWNPESRSTEKEQSLDWVTETPRNLNPDAIWATSTLQDKTVKAEKGVDLLEFGPKSTTFHSLILPTTSSSTVSHWNKADDEEPTTTLPLHSTSTVSEEAWNLRPDLVTSTQSPDNPKATHYSIPTVLSIQKHTEVRHLPVELPQFQGEKSEKKEKDYLENSPSPDPAGPFWFTVQPTLGESRSSGENLNSNPKDQDQTHNSSGFLVALLVPICIFIVVMVTLVIVYYTRCAVQPRNQNITDCYHWISRAHDKHKV